MCFEVDENNQNEVLYIHGTLCGGKYFVLSRKSIFEYMDDSKPPIDIDVIEECRSEKDFDFSKYSKEYRIVNDILDNLTK